MAKTLKEKIAQTVRWAATRAIGTPHMPVEEVVAHATADAMRALDSDISAARIEELKAALEPLAKMADHFDRTAMWGNPGGPMGPMPDTTCVAGVQIGWLRSARAALGQL